MCLRGEPGSQQRFGVPIKGVTGALTAVAGSPFPAGTNPALVAVIPTGQFGYVANEASRNVSAYSIDGVTGALTAVPGSSFPVDSFARGITSTAGPAPLPTP